MGPHARYALRSTVTSRPLALRDVTFGHISLAALSTRVCRTVPPSNDLAADAGIPVPAEWPPHMETARPGEATATG